MTTAMKTIMLTKQEVDAEPFRIWNAYVGMLAMRYHDLAKDQRPAHLVFWYESEVQNGGHLQYFENRGAEYLTEDNRSPWTPWSSVPPASSSRSR